MKIQPPSVKKIENNPTSICTFDKYITFAEGKTNYITKNKNSKMKTLEITIEKTTENVTLYYGEIRKFISTNAFTSKFSLLNTKEEFEPIITMENEEKYLYEVKTTRSEMKHLYKRDVVSDAKPDVVCDIKPSDYENYKIIGEGKIILSYFGAKINRATVNSSQAMAKKTFTSPVNYDDGYQNNQIANEVVSTMELYKTYQTGTYFIEWYIAKLDIVEQIGVFCNQNDKVLSDYDGVFDMPKQARQLLEDNGFNCSYLD